MISKNRRKRVTRLHLKKYRDLEGLFIAEGDKVVEDLLSAGLRMEECWFCPATTQGKGNLPEFLRDHAHLCHEATPQDMSAVSQMTTPPGLLGVFVKPQIEGPDFTDWVVAVDRLQDPGNLGTLIRSCDWFGIRHLLCSEGTVDAFNHKVVQASMGAIARVNLHYLDLVKALETAPVPVYGTFLEGENVYTARIPVKGILLMGNESQGIHPDYGPLLKGRLHIPPQGVGQVESLNIGVAAGIFLSEIRRRDLANP